MISCSPSNRSRTPRFSARIAVSAACAALASLTVLAVVSPQSASAKLPPKKAAPAVISEAPADIKACNGCHAPTLAGRPGFSPSIRASGALKEYNKQQFEKLLADGSTNDGGKLKKMPVLHYPAAKSDKIYAYLKTQK